MKSTSKGTETTAKAPVKSDVTTEGKSIDLKMLPWALGALGGSSMFSNNANAKKL